MNILFIEDHVLIREALIYMLKKLYKDSFIIETSTVIEAMQLIPNIKSLDMILLDIALPGLDGLSALPDLKKQVGSSVPIVVLTGSDDSTILRKAKEQGAADCIHKNCNKNEFINRLKFILDNVAEQISSNAKYFLSEPLTSREKEILQLIARGDQDKVIAFKLGITTGTTKNHVSRILLKLNAENRLGAVLKAIKLKIIPPLN